jgi:polyphosphate kinase
VFNYLTGYVTPERLENLAISPHMIKPRILEGLDAEIAHAKAGRPARVWVKLNALTDPEVIDALYAASQAGVKIDMVIRGICSARAGVKGLSEARASTSPRPTGWNATSTVASRRWWRSPTRRCTPRSWTRS